MTEEKQEVTREQWGNLGKTALALAILCAGTHLLYRATVAPIKDAPDPVPEHVEMYDPSTDPLNQYSIEDINALTDLIFGESRGSNYKASVAMAYTALERMSDSRWPSNLNDVILQDKQYSCFNDNDPNKEKIKEAKRKNPKTWLKCRNIAFDVLEGKVENPFPGANHYHACGSDNRPGWTDDGTNRGIIESTEFWRL